MTAVTNESLTSEETIELFKTFVIPNYGRYPVNLVRGEGSNIWDSEGNKYLDLFPGWGCNLLGHCPDKIVKAVQDQVATLIHVPNTWHMESQGKWAKLLSERSFGGQAFFCNSGAEANEAAIKLARLHSPAGRYKIITFEGGFHGRTYGAVSATAQPKYHENIGPMMAGFTYAPRGDLEAVRSCVDDETCAIMIEPIQGEGGIVIPDDGYLQGLRDIADENGLLLIFDEVQCGCGRTGKWFAYQHFDVTPDIMTLAKSICGGIAGAAMMAKREIAPSLRPGMHAATFGGNPIAARAGIAMIEMVDEGNLLEHAQAMSDVFREELLKLADECDLIQEVRILGMMVGIQLTTEGNPIVAECLRRKLLINCTQQTVIRLLPAMNISESQVREGVSVLGDVLKNHVV